MIVRRAFLIAGSISLISLRTSAQGESRIRNLPAGTMRQHRVSGASVALVHNGEIAERSFGVALMTNADGADADR
jgi:CubicO group peptidase (beta-lactamase class C family)